MNQIHAKIVVTVAVAVAFFWGYQGRWLVGLIDGWRKPALEAPAADIQSTVTALPVAAPEHPAQPVPPGIRTPAAPHLPPPLAQRGPGGPRPPNIAETVQSVSGGESREDAASRRNLYLEKLSDQARSLQGDAPPIPPVHPLQPPPPFRDGLRPPPPPGAAQELPSGGEVQTEAEPDEELDADTEDAVELDNDTEEDAGDDNEPADEPGDGDDAES